MIKRKLVVLLCVVTIVLPAMGERADFVKFEAAREHFRKGLVHYNRWQYLAAVEYFRRAVATYPEYNTGRDYLARAYQMAGFHDEALRELENLKEASGGSPAVISRIENLRFRHSGVGYSHSVSDLVLNRTYHAREMKRYSFFHPVDCVVDPARNLLVTSFSDGKVVEIDVNGKGKEIIRPGMGGKYYGIDLREGRLAFSSFSEDRVYIGNRQGEVTSILGESGSGEGEFHGPEGLAFDSEGFLYVVDSGNHRVQKFRPDGTFVLSMGNRGKYEGELTRPSDVHVMGDQVYVSDTGSSRIALFDISGNFIKNMTFPDLDSPRGITSYMGTLYVADSKKGLIMIQPDSGRHAWFSSWNDGKESFNSLMGAAFDREGNLYCVDHGSHSVHIFSPVQKMYSNLSVEIAAIDSGQFPTVALFLNIRGADGNPVYGLTRENFSLTEDGAPIQHYYTGYLKKLRPSISVVLCVDRSRDMAGYHNELSWVSDFILKKMHKNDSLKVMNFNQGYWEGNPWDWSRRRALRALRQREYGEGKNYGKALYNALTEVVDRLNRRSVVLLTEGSVAPGSFDQYTEENIVNYARTHYIPIHVIHFREPASVLKRIARDTGGELIHPGEVSRLREIYPKIRESEEYRYLLIYSTFKGKNLSGLWSDIDLEVDGMTGKGRAHGGYFVP